jgi:hypothetical protein
MDESDPGSSPDMMGAGPVEYRPAEIRATGGIAAVRDRHEAALFAIPGVTHVGIGQGLTGEDAINIGVLDPSVGARIPRVLDGVPVLVIVTGHVDALARPQR